MTDDNHIPASEVYTSHEPECPMGYDFTQDVRATVAVSVTVKIDVHGSTPEQLTERATVSAMGVIEDALAATYRNMPSNTDKYVWATFTPGMGDVLSTISVEGATALVNSEALNKLFERSE